MRNLLNDLRLLAVETLIDIAITLAPNNPAGRRLADLLSGTLGAHILLGIAETEG